MTDPSTLFLSTPQIRPSWTINGLTLELNIAPSHGGNNSVAGNNSYGNQTFSANGAAAGAVYASVVGQGQCSTPLRLAVRGGTSCWSHTTSSEPVSTGMPAVVGDSVFAITQSAAFLSTGLANNGSNSLSGSIPATAAQAGGVSAAALVPSNAVFEQSINQLQHLMAKGFLNNSIANSPNTVANNCVAEDNEKKKDNGQRQKISEKKRKSWKNSNVVVTSTQSVNDVACTVTNKSASVGTTAAYTMYEFTTPTSMSSVNTINSEGISAPGNNLSVSVNENTLLSPNTTTMSPSDQRSSRPLRPIAVKKDANGTPCQVAEITTSSIHNRNDHSPSPGTTPPKPRDFIQSPPPNFTAATTVSHLSTTSQPITLTGVPSSSTTSTVLATNTNMVNGNIPVGIAVARQRYASNSNSNSKPTCKETISSSATSTYSSVIPYHQTLLPSAFASSISNMSVIAEPASCEGRNTTDMGTGGGLPPPVVAWPTHSTGLPSQQHATQQWHSYTSPLESQIPTNIPAPCGNFQLARDPVSGQIILIPASQIDSLQQRTAFLIPGGVQPPTTGYSSTNQQIQSFLIPQQQQQPSSYSLFLDHLVTIVPSNINVKQKPVPSTVVKLEDGPITGVMMPCDVSKSPALNPNPTTAIGQQLISTNNSSFSLVQQLTSSNIHNTNLNMPHHFSSISSTGSLLIQQISGNTGPPPLINHVNNSLLISAESAATQSVINSQPQYASSNASFLINTHQISSENSTVIDQVQTSPCIISTTAQQSNFNQFPIINNNVSCVKAPSPNQMKSSETKCSEEIKLNSSDQVCSNHSDKTSEETVIKVDMNSSVQDASNQTETEMPYQDDSEMEEDEDDDEMEENIEFEKNQEIQKVYSDENPDFSGLQLLLNGIERVEHNRDVNGDFMILNGEKSKNICDSDDEKDKNISKPAPNGLEILCALADQRFLEENVGDETPDSGKKKTSPKSNIHQEVGHHYQSAKSEQETRRILSSKYNQNRVRSLSPCDGDQQKMRIELARLQKKYRETRKELNRLTHRKYTSSSSTRSPTPSLDALSQPNETDKVTPVKRRPGRPRKYSDLGDTKLSGSKKPKLKIGVASTFVRTEKETNGLNSARNDDLSPPVLEPMCSSPKGKPFKNDVLSPPTLIPSKKSCYKLKDSKYAREQSVFDFKSKSSFLMHSSDDSSEDEIEESRPKILELPKKPIFDEADINNEVVPQKRKVGRPRKYPKEDPNDSVTKKSKLNGNSSLLNKSKDSPFSTFGSKSEKTVLKQVPVTSSVVSTFALLKSQRKTTDLNRNTEVENKPRITPKLKAEAKLKSWRQESPEMNKDTLDSVFDFSKRKIDSCDYSSSKESKHYSAKRRKYHHFIKTKDYSSSYSGSAVRVPSLTSDFDNKDFRITPELLDSVEKCPLRVLIAVGGLFRVGKLFAVRAPDLYGIKLDGERGQKTHIFTKEEVLRDLVLEVEGKYPLKNGTRVCAFWSSQYLSLYPGYVTPFSSSEDSEDEYFASVEFDDGDSGRINIKDIRLLPKDFSINRHFDDDVNPLRRKRRISSMSFEEIPIDKQLHSPESPSLSRETNNNQNDSPPTSYDSSSHSSFNNESLPIKADDICLDRSTCTDEKTNVERKRLKKKRKDKFRDDLDSCKKKSHKRRTSSEESISKAHKRRKHKHKHHKHHKRRHSSSERKNVETGQSNQVEKTDHNSNVKNSDSHSQDQPEKCSGWKSEYDFTDSSKKRAKLNIDIDSDTSLDVERDVEVEPNVLNGQENENRQDEKKLSEEDSVLADECENDKLPCDRVNENDTTSEKASEKSNSEVESENDEVKEEEVIGEEDLENDEQEENDLNTNDSRTDQSVSDKNNEDEQNSEENIQTNSNDKFWSWVGRGFKRNGKGRAKKEFFRSIKRDNVTISNGDCAVFLTADSPAKPYIGRVESMWESYGNMMVRVSWFYHPEETTGLTQELPYLGALFESSHTDKNDVQTISHKCQVVSLNDYKQFLEKEPKRIRNVYQSNDLYYLAGYYDPTAKLITFKDGVLS